MKTRIQGEKKVFVSTINYIQSELEREHFPEADQFSAHTCTFDEAMQDGFRERYHMGAWRRQRHISKFAHCVEGSPWH